MKAVAILSGGLDSSTLAYYYKSKGYELDLITFDYGQKHSREIDHAIKIAKELNAPHQLIDINGIRQLLKGSSLTDSSVATPLEQYDKATMQLTVVPNRNAIMLSIAYGYACTSRAEVLVCGVHAGDHYLYPDCRPEFIEQLNIALFTGTEDVRHPNLRIEATFVHMSKADILKIGAGLGVPFELTWSCYEGGELHCGRCGSCRSRKQAFAEASIADPTIYFK